MNLVTGLDIERLYDRFCGVGHDGPARVLLYQSSRLFDCQGMATLLAHICAEFPEFLKNLSAQNAAATIPECFDQCSGPLVFDSCRAIMREDQNVGVNKAFIAYSSSTREPGGHQPRSKPSQSRVKARLRARSYFLRSRRISSSLPASRARIERPSSAAKIRISRRMAASSFSVIFVLIGTHGSNV